MTSSCHQRDTTFTKIFVGGLPYHTTNETLQKFFEPFGSIEEAVVITERQTGKSRGYGFVTMLDRTAAERACKDPNPIIDGRKANVNLAYLGAKPRIPVGEFIASFPFGLKGGPASVPYLGPEIVGYPPLIYLPQGNNPVTLTQPQILHRSVNTAQLVDYATILGTHAVPFYQDPLVKLAAYPHVASAMTIEGGYRFAGPSAAPTAPQLALVRPGMPPSSSQGLIAVAPLQHALEQDPRWRQEKSYLG